MSTNLSIEEMDDAAVDTPVRGLSRFLLFFSCENGQALPFLQRPAVESVHQSKAWGVVNHSNEHSTLLKKAPMMQRERNKMTHAV